MKVTLKIGGFLFPRELDPLLIGMYARELNRLHDKGHRLLVITGGGEVARRYIDEARRLGASEGLCDVIGIQVSRLNASLILSSLDERAYPCVPTSFEEALSFTASGRIVVSGGLQPGQSTNAVAALLAEAIKADLLINLTDVDGVFTEDPKLNPAAKKLEEVTVTQMIELVSGKSIVAGGYKLLDPIALRVIGRSRIPTKIVNGREVSNLERAIKGEAVGTRIVPE
ncbi:MAG: UMP kinase [Candidatus Bathyarchaeia archaeon]